MKLDDLLKCDECGNVVEVEFVGGGEIICCGEPMKVLEENTTDAAQEKHVPVIEEKGDGILVKVGSVPHPMLEEHYITMIQVFCSCGTVMTKRLKPGEAPEAEFPVKKENVVKVREYCNIHGLWAAK